MKRLIPTILGIIFVCAIACGMISLYFEAHKAQIQAFNEGAQFMDANDLRLEGQHLGLACVTKDGTNERVCPNLTFTPTKNVEGDNIIYVVQENDIVYIGNATDSASADILKKPGTKLYKISYQEDTGADWLPEPALAAEEYLVVWCSNYLAVSEGLTCSHTYSIHP